MSRHQDLSLGMGSAPRAVHTLGFTPGLPPSILTLKNGGCFAAPKHLPRDIWHGRLCHSPRHSCAAGPMSVSRMAPNLQSCSAAQHTQGRIHPPLFLFISLVSAPLPLAEAVSGWGN